MNKPKALVPVDNRPMIFHLFECYPNAKFLIIADYQKEMLRRYLASFATVDYDVIDAEKRVHSSASEVHSSVYREGTLFTLVWCVIILSDVIGIPERTENNYIGISKDFPCRWSFREGHFVQESSSENGVAGLFIFRDKEQIADVRDLVPFAQDEWVTVNGKRCRNIYAIKDKIIEEMRGTFPKEFHFIHGDCTFHNVLPKSEVVQPVLIDPRGHFGRTALYGDADYDWAELYYSVVGGYDQFNRKNFSSVIGENGTELEIVPNGWGALQDDFFELRGAARRKVRLLHAIMWLNLTTYAWEDYDAICEAYYKGLLELQNYSDNMPM